MVTDQTAQRHRNGQQPRRLLAGQILQLVDELEIGNVWDQPQLANTLETHLQHFPTRLARNTRLASSSATQRKQVEHTQKDINMGDMEPQPAPESVANMSMDVVEVEEVVATATQVEQPMDFEVHDLPRLHNDFDPSEEVVENPIEDLEEPAGDGLPADLENGMVELWDESGQSEEESVGDEGDGEEDDDFPDIVWEHLQQRSGLEPLPQLGAESRVLLEKARNNTLTDSEHEVIQTFSFRHRHKVGSKIYNALKEEYPGMRLQSLKRLKSQMEWLSGLKGTYLDCCQDSCCAFTGQHSKRIKCPYCSKNRYDESGKAVRQYQYLPLIPRVQAAFGSRTSAEQQRYRAERHDPEFGKIKDYLDGKLYRDACRRRVQVAGQTLDHNHFSDTRDIAILLFSDGFQIFKKGRHSAWATMAVNLNLPPELRYHLDETWTICIIPGPNQPKDPDSFHWPLVEELTTAAFGIPTYDAMADKVFLLHIYALMGGGDGPGAAKCWLHSKIQNAYSPCRACEIHSVRPPTIPGKRGAPVSYVPLKPPVGYDREEQDPLGLPLRAHATFLRQANEVQMAATAAESSRLSILYGINGTSIYSQISSFRFPNSFPVDFMHLLENIMESLVLLWTGAFKGLDEGNGNYIIDKTVWEAIGSATEAASTHLPATFGRRLPNIAQDRTYYTAEAWLIWTTLLARPLLCRRFKHPRYYDHFVQLVHLFTACMEYEIKVSKVEEIRQGFAVWVQEFERIYYQYNANRLSICTLQIHMLLHIADMILDAGPVWVYWVFVMERLCGRLQRSVSSRRHPYASMNMWVLEWEQLKVVKNRFGLLNVFRPNPANDAKMTFLPSYPHAGLLRPRMSKVLSADYHQRVVAAIGTLYNKPNNAIQHLISRETICWSRIQRIGGGDLFRIAAAVERTSGKHRDNSFVRYELLVDVFAHQRRRKPVLVPHTYFGRLLEIFEVALPAGSSFEPEKTTLLLALIQPCDTTFDKAMGAYTYRRYKPLEVVDLQTLQAVVGRIPVGNEWIIVDRSGELARATFIAGGNNSEDSFS